MTWVSQESIKWSTPQLATSIPLELLFMISHRMKTSGPYNCSFGGVVETNTNSPSMIPPTPSQIGDDNH